MFKDFCKLKSTLCSLFIKCPLCREKVHINFLFLPWTVLKAKNERSNKNFHYIGPLTRFWLSLIGQCSFSMGLTYSPVVKISIKQRWNSNSSAFISEQLYLTLLSSKTLGKNYLLHSMHIGYNSLLFFYVTSKQIILDVLIFKIMKQKLG